MNVILIPGLWLDASSWDAVVPTIEQAGHRVRALTMPGVGAPESESSEIGIDDWVDAVVAEVDAAGDDVVLVGHSGGGNVAWGAADRRPDRVARVVFVDTIAPAPGRGISEFDVIDGVVPFPGWDFFDEPDVADLDAATRERTLALTSSVPAKVPTDPIRLDDERRHAVPATFLSGMFAPDAFRAAIAEWGPYAAEFDAIDDAEIVHIASGHWPQFSKPDELADAIVAAIR